MAEYYKLVKPNTFCFYFTIYFVFYFVLFGGDIIRSTIICVDDERLLLEALYNQVNSWFGKNYYVEKALNGEDALKILDNCISEGRDVSVFISDYIMPNMKGDQLLIEVGKRDPRIKKIMVTGFSAIDGIINAINNAGLYRFIQKPWDLKDLMLTLLEAIKSYENEKLSHSITVKYQELYTESAKKTEALLDIITYAIDSRDFKNMGHSKRVAKYAKILAKELKFEKERLDILKYAALLHDVGKIIMDDADLSFLRTKGIYDEQYYPILFTQISNTEELISNFEFFDDIMPIIRYQFEQNSGQGPFKLREEKIPLESQIIHIANYFDNLRNDQTRTYTLEQIIECFEEKKGIVFDFKLVDVFIGLIRPII